MTSKSEGRAHLVGGLVLVMFAAWHWHQREKVPPIESSAIDDSEFSLTDEGTDGGSAAPESASTSPRNWIQVYRRPLRSGGGGPEMAKIYGGRFLMGSPESEAGRRVDEGPVNEMAIRTFGIGTTEVTFNEWDRCVSAGACKPKPLDWGWGRGTRPVINVTWDDAQAYAAWLSQETGRRYRLPTESEWEYAARGGSADAYWWGDSADRSRANFGSGRYGLGSAEGTDLWVYTSPVKSFKPNPLGLYDIAGNVGEWVADCYEVNYQAQAGARSADAASCDQRVVRGGSWADGPAELRSAARGRAPPTAPSREVGFRVAEDLSDASIYLPGTRFVPGSSETEAKYSTGNRPQ